MSLIEFLIISCWFSIAIDIYIKLFCHGYYQWNFSARCLPILKIFVIFQLVIIGNSFFHNILNKYIVYVDVINVIINHFCWFIF